MKSDRSAGWALAGAVCGGAFSGGALWFVVDRMAVVNGRGLLVRAGRPLDTPILFAVAGAVIALLSLIRANRRARYLRERLPEIAGLLGLAYEEGEVEIPPDARPGAPLFEHWGRCENRLSGTTNGAAASMYDLTTIRKADDGTTHLRWTVIVYPETHLPAFACVPRSWSTLAARATLPSIDFDPDATDQMTRQAVTDFQKAYQLSLIEPATKSDEEKVRRLFCAPRLEALARDPGWHIQSVDELLVFARRGTAPAADRPTLWHSAAELRRALLAPVSHAATIIPAAPGMDLGRQRCRSTGRRAGGLVGVVVGFFGSFIAFSAVLASRTGPHAGGLRQPPMTGMFLAFVGSVASGLVVGAVVGFWLGGRIADRFYRPTSDGTPAPKIRNGWVIAGAFLGWVVGGAIGMGITVLVSRQIRAHDWLMPIAFFSPPVVCLVLGGFAGYRVACRRAARRTGA